MKKRVCRGIAMAATALCVLLLCAVIRPLTVSVLAESGASGSFSQASDSRYQWTVAENDSFELMANEDGTIAVLDKESGYLYSSNPLEEDPIATGLQLTNLQSQIYIAYSDTTGSSSSKNSKSGSVAKEGLTWEATDDGGIRYNYYFPDCGIIVPVEYHLTEYGLDATIVVGEIEECLDDCSYYLTSVTLLPFFGAADSDTEGYLFVPDGSGALIYYNNDKSSYGSYSQEVYGRDTALVVESLTAETETIRMPVFGTTDYENGFLAIVTEGETNATINAMTSGSLNNYNYVYASFRYHAYTVGSFSQGSEYATNGVGGANQTAILLSTVLPEGDYTVSYYLLHEEDLDYVSLAQVYREYLIEEKGLSVSSGVTSAPLYVELLGGLRLEESVLGVEVKLMETLTTYEEAEEILELLQTAGVEDMVVKYRGWQSGGIESKTPSKISFAGKLGGSSGYSSLVEYVEEKGIGLFLDFDYVNLYEGGNGVSYYSDAVLMPGSTPSYQYTYNYNTLSKNEDERWKILTPLLVQESVEKMLTDSDKLKGANISLSTLGNNIYSDFTHKEAIQIDRSDTLALWEEIFGECADTFGMVMTDGGNVYSAPFVTHIYGVSVSDSGYDIEDESIPFYQIVLHGYVSYSTEPVNLDADPDYLVLKAVETGSSIAACLMYADSEVLMDSKYNTIYSGNYEAWIDRLGEYYERTHEFLEAVSSCEITDHARLQEDVYRTEFSDGTVVYVNYSGKSVTVEGVTVPAEDFVWQKGGEA